MHRFFSLNKLQNKLIITSLVLLLVAIFVFADDDVNDNPPTVTTKSGKVIGYYKKSAKGRPYEVYQGIPYAEPPVGNLRFEEALPAKPWVVLNATAPRSVCAQYVDVPPDKNGNPVVNNRTEGEDDCLYLNINVPVVKNKTRKMPVIFFIHGGSFQYGSGVSFSEYNIYMTDRDVIFVSINYRVGIQGFLSTEDEVLPGNLGLKDQNLALRWTHDNIENFGGDPNKIILVGFSAGSSSVQYHHLSPLSRGLFSASLAYSGAVYNPWGFASNSAEKAKKLGSLFNCTTKNSRLMIDCLKKVPAQILADATKEFQYFAYMPEAPFAPVIEKAGRNPFISKSPEKIAADHEFNDVPIIFGTVSQEGCDPGAGYAPHDNIMKYLNDNWVKVAPYLLQYNYTIKKQLHDKVAIMARKEYFGKEKITPAVGNTLIKLLSDVHYFLGIEKGVRLQAKAMTSPVYFYFYSYRASRSRSVELSHTNIDYGVCHCDDVLLVFDDSQPARKKKEDLDMLKFFLNMIESLAYEGKPNIGKWEPVNASSSAINYLHIPNPYDYKMSSNSNLGNKVFWKQFFNLDV